MQQFTIAAIRPVTLSSTCVLSGTPDATATGAFYTITGTNTGGSDTASLYIEVRSYGGTLSVTPSNTEGSVNSSISDISMSYTHQLSNYGWTSGVSNTTTTLSNNFLTAGGTHLLGIDSGDQGEMVVVYAHNDTSSASGTYSLGMMYRWGGTWTETILDTGTDTGYHPSVAIDRQGAIHIAYIDDHNDELRYATNASGSWVFTTLGSSTYDNDDGRGTAIVVHPITDAVHIVTTINDNTYRDLQYHTNEDGSWVNTTITNTLSDEGHDPAMAMDADGNLHVAYYCDDGCSDLRLSSRINGVWQNETVASTLNIGNDPDITIDSQGTIHIVSQYLNNKRIYLHSGTPGSWTEQTGLSGGNAHWPVVSVDSNDAVHISYHFGNIQKDVMYMTNASGSWSTASMIEGYGGWGSEMVIDANDDIFIPNVAPGITEIQLTTVKGSGQGLTARPTYDIAPMLPDGLIMNWRNGTISGTPTEALANTTFTVTVTALGATTTGTFTLYIPDAPGPFEYNPENNTLTKNTEVHLAPQFLNQTTGNGSAWRVADINSGSTGSDPGKGMSIVVGNVLYFGADDGSNGIELWAYNTSNTTTWLVEDIRPGSSSSNPGSNMMQVINGVLYFNAVDGSTGQELWKHDPSTGTTSRVYDLNSGSSGSSIGLRMSMVVGDVLYFSANDGSTGHELWAYNTSNSSNPWQVMDINSGSGSSDPGTYLENVVGDTLYFSALGVTSVGASNGIELWAHNTSNLTTWEVANINYWYQQGYPGMYLDIVVGDTLYFSAKDGTDGHELWAHNTSNESTWQVADIANGATDSKPGDSMAILIGDTIYFDADDGNTGIELWAHDTSNHSTWQVADINSGASDSDVGEYMSVSIGNTLLFSAEDGTNGKELWAHDTLNGTTWMTSDMGLYTIPGYRMSIVAGDTLFFDDGGSEPYAYSTSNATTWRIADINSGSSASYPGWYMSALIGDTLYFDAEDGSTGKELWAFAINGVNFMTNTGGVVTSYEINPSLPSGLSFGTSNGTIWGTPTVLQTTAVTYTIYANNSGGSVNATVNITINDESPDISYNPDWFVLTKGTAMSPTVTPTNTGGAIPSGIVDSGSNIGAHTSIALDSNGYKHISYFDTTSNNLKYATDKSGSWVTTSIDTSANVGYYTSIAIDSNDDVHISYYSSTNGDLKYATDKSGSWVTTSIDTIGNVGAHTSIAIDSNDDVHISYRDATNTGLKYATDKSGSWVTTSIDTSGNVGDYTSIAIDSNDDVHISYYDLQNGDLKYATDKSGSWVTTSIDTSGNVGAYTSIAFDSNDDVHISYYDYTNDDLKYATDKSGSWVTTSIDTSLYVGYYSSIAIDSNDYVHISHYDLQNGDLKYATDKSGSWATTSIDTSGNVGAYTSIAIDSNDDVHISYYDTTNTELKYIGLDSSSNVLGYSVSPDLPAGLSLNIATGEISGTPTALSINTTYTITVTNSGGTNTTTITIEVLDQLPTLSYSPSTLVLTKDNQSSDLPLNATLTGSGTITSWAISPALPSGLSFGTSNGTIWGIPTVLQTTATTYTVWANNSGGSSSATVTITINDEAPGPFEYNPENNTLTNNTYVHLEPDFINMTTGNGSSWSTAPAGYQLTRTDWPNEPCLNHTYNGTTYVSYNSKLHGYGIANNTLWLINNTIQDVGCYTYSQWPSGTGYSEGLSQMYGTSLYFIGKDGSDRKLYGYGMENETVWVESTAEPHVWSMLVDDVMYFYGETGNSGYELHGHNLSNGTTWMLDDIYSGSGSITGPVLGQNWPVLVGSTFVFVAVFSNGSTYQS